MGPLHVAKTCEGLFGKAPRFLRTPLLHEARHQILQRRSKMRSPRRRLAQAKASRPRSIARSGLPRLCSRTDRFTRQGIWASFTHPI